MITASIPTLRTRFRAMASSVTVRLEQPGPGAQAALDEVREVFTRIERSCTRFDPDSDLMRANAAGRRWSSVAPECLRVLRRAHEAYRATDGAFDPRTLESLVALGYDRSWEQLDDAPLPQPVRARRPRRWRPTFDEDGGRVRIGSRPVDLGGIGKGVAVREAMALLKGHGRSILVEAGGDLAVGGPGPQGQGWRVAVENPFGGGDPAAVWQVTDTAVATSSIRRRQWRSGGSTAHHLIDPRTGQPADSGLISVSVVHAQADTAEVWTKVAFLRGRERIRRLLDDADLPAVWIEQDGRVRYSRAAAPLLIWKASRVRG